MTVLLGSVGLRSIIRVNCGVERHLGLLWFRMVSAVRGGVEVFKTFVTFHYFLSEVWLVSFKSISCHFFGFCRVWNNSDWFRIQSFFFIFLVS